MNVVISHDQNLAAIYPELLERRRLLKFVRRTLNPCIKCAANGLGQCGYLPCLDYERKDGRRGHWKRVYT